MLDLIIKNGRIIDGAGTAEAEGDVGVKDGRIVALGLVNEDAQEVLDAAGCAVAPGFVDVHTHYDAQVFWDPALSPSCHHGVTTVFGGNCGFSIAPLSPEAAPYLLRMLARVEGMPEVCLEEGVPWNWRSFGDYLARIEGHLGRQRRLPGGAQRHPSGGDGRTGSGGAGQRRRIGGHEGAVGGEP